MSAVVALSPLVVYALLVGTTYPQLTMVAAVIAVSLLVIYALLILLFRSSQCSVSFLYGELTCSLWSLGTSFTQLMMSAVVTVSSFVVYDPLVFHIRSS